MKERLTITLSLPAEEKAKIVEYYKTRNLAGTALRLIREDMKREGANVHRES